MKLFAALITIFLGALLQSVACVPLKNKIAQSKSEFRSSMFVGMMLIYTGAYKSYIVSFSDSVTPSVVDAAMQKVRETEGTITHVFSIINGFLAIASEEAMENISTLSEGITVDEDQVVTTSS